MRHSKKFNSLLLQYEAITHASPRKTTLFFEMEKTAKTFSDWASIYQYAGSSKRKDAQRKMEDTFLRGGSRKDIQMNIHELFMICDIADMDKFLKLYLEKYHKKDDLLFAVTESDWSTSDLMTAFMQELKNKFGVVSISDELRDRRRKTEEMMKKSTFNP